MYTSLLESVSLWSDVLHLTNAILPFIFVKVFGHLQM